MIDGVKIKKLIVHEDERGDFREIIRINEGLVKKISQVSISKTKPGVIKAFHWHKYQDDLFYVLKGNIKLVLYDQREDSKTRSQLQEMLLGESYPPNLVFIPRKVLHGYKVIGEKEAEVLYIMNNVYNSKNPDEERVPFNDSSINFNWNP